VKFLIYIFLFLFAEFSFAQNEASPIFAQSESMPEFPGGPSEMMKFIQINIMLPTNVSGKAVDGKCFLKFVVNDSGRISDVQVLKGVLDCPQCDVEAIRVIKLMPKWTPGIQNGKPVSVFFNLPIRFNIPNGYRQFEHIVNQDKVTTPVFRGGPEEMMKFINKNKEYSPDLKKQKIIGQSIVKFFVDSTGKVCQLSVRQSSGNLELDTEALRVVSIMPNWIPAYIINSKRRVGVFCDLPVSFGKESELSEVKKINKELSQMSFKKGIEFSLSENLSDAKEEYKKAYIFDCYNGDALYNLGITYFKLNQSDSACVSWKELKENFGRTDADNLIKKYCSN